LKNVSDVEFLEIAQSALDDLERLRSCTVSNGNNAAQLRTQFQKDMSDYAGAVRRPDAMVELLHRVDALLNNFDKKVGATDFCAVLDLYDCLLTQKLCLEAMCDFYNKIGASRGSAIYTDPKGCSPDLPEEIFCFCPQPRAANAMIQEVMLENREVRINWRPVRTIPEKQDVFETVWRQYRENHNVF